MAMSEAPQVASESVRSNVLSAAAGADIAHYRLDALKREPGMAVSDVRLLLNEAQGELERTLSFVMRARQEVERAAAA